MADRSPRGKATPQAPKAARKPAVGSAVPGAAPARRGGRAAGGSLDGGRARDREVIETAVRIFWEKGYAGASVQDVADALGMLKGSLYYYIDSKESLLLKIFEDSHNEIVELVDAATSSEGRAVDRLATYLREYAMWTLAHLERAGLLAREWRHAPEPLRSTLAERSRYYDRVLADLIAEARAEGDIPADVDPRRASVFIWSAFTSLPDWYQPSRGKPQKISDDYVQLAMSTLGAHI